LGFLDKFTKSPGSERPVHVKTVKGPSAILREHGINPLSLKFSYGEDGSLTVSGPPVSRSDGKRICEVLETIPHVKSVNGNFSAAWSKPAPVPEFKKTAD
jgi:hypothetical protein